jgi:hypothetical protein
MEPSCTKRRMNSRSRRNRRPDPRSFRTQPPRSVGPRAERPHSRRASTSAERRYRGEREAARVSESAGLSDRGLTQRPRSRARRPSVSLLTGVSTSTPPRPASSRSPLDRASRTSDEVRSPAVPRTHNARSGTLLASRDSRRMPPQSRRRSESHMRPRAGNLMCAWRRVIRRSRSWSSRRGSTTMLEIWAIR